jgi:hypothetical protein
MYEKGEYVSMHISSSKLHYRFWLNMVYWGRGQHQKMSVIIEYEGCSGLQICKKNTFWKCVYSLESTFPVLVYIYNIVIGKLCLSVLSL